MGDEYEPQTEGGDPADKPVVEGLPSDEELEQADPPGDEPIVIEEMDAAEANEDDTVDDAEDDTGDV